MWGLYSQQLHGSKDRSVESVYDRPYEKGTGRWGGKKKKKKNGLEFIIKKEFHQKEMVKDRFNPQKQYKGMCLFFQEAVLLVWTLPIEKRIWRSVSFHAWYIPCTLHDLFMTYYLFIDFFRSSTVSFSPFPKDTKIILTILKI